MDDQEKESLFYGDSSHTISLGTYKPTSLADVIEVMVDLNENTKETNRLLTKLIEELNNEV